MPPRKRGSKPSSPKSDRGSKGKGRGGSRRTRATTSETSADAYRHSDAELATRPEIGTQAQFRKKKPPKTYKYDSSLSPALDWDGQNAAREVAEALIQRIRDAKTVDEAHAAADELARLSSPFLNWAGKAERLSFDVPTLPMFVHERLATSAILETLKRHRRDQQETLDLFGDPQHSVADQVLRAYEHRDRWVNRAVLGDSLVVMNSLLEYEGLGGQVQLIYIDPPYGVKFGSNFQPFVRKRDVKHNDDAHLTREPEMVQAYRDTWELGLHSYLTYLRDRLLLARDLLTPSGSVFVQISDENLHHVREVMDEVFGAENAIAQVAFAKTTSASGKGLSAVADYLVWYAKDRTVVKIHELYMPKTDPTGQYTWIEDSNRTRRNLGSAPAARAETERGARVFRPDNLTSQRPAGAGDVTRFTFDGREFSPGKGTFKSDKRGLSRLAERGRLIALGNTLCYVRYLDDFPVVALSNVWDDTVVSGFADRKQYVVQTSPIVVQRCLLMTTDPGDLVLDPTCGSGTTAYVAEQWGRRWITIDTSRVPLALTRQRILTATFPWYELRDQARGPAGGFVYDRKQNNRGEEVGGIVPHVTLKSIANDEPPKEEVLVDRPNVDRSITRVSGPFVVEATIPTPVDFEGDGVEDSGAPLIAAEHGSFVERMIYVLQKSPVLQVAGGKTVTLRNVRPPARTLSLSAEAIVDTNAAVAIVFGPESGAVTEKLVFNAGREASAKTYTHLYVIGFAIQPTARETIEKAAEIFGVPATYVQATPDLMMGDLLKNMRSSQIFSVCGLPEIEIVRLKPAARGEPEKYQVRLLGLDTFEPITMEAQSLEAE
ncbi:MAG: DNA methyltransferase, partial [Gemmatimonadaceae bacterium]